MNSQFNSYGTRTTGGTRNNEGVLASIGEIFLNKTDRESLRAQRHNRSTITVSAKTDVRKQLSISSYDIPIEPEILSDWVIDLHKTVSRPLDDFFSKQKFEGVVVEIKADSFVARLRNITEMLPDEEGEFLNHELSKDDLELLKVGAVFYWNIGYLVQVAGQRIGCHMINFRRLPVLASHEILAADERAEDLFSWLTSGQD
jgi:hypothetical protein